jgi:hypothetical protein
VKPARFALPEASLIPPTITCKPLNFVRFSRVAVVAEKPLFGYNIAYYVRLQGLLKSWFFLDSNRRESGPHRKP